MCLAKGGSLEPSFTPEVISEYMEDFSKGEKLKPLPLGAYEYECCVEYLKKIRRTLVASRENFRILTIVFDEANRYNMVTPPVEDCLYKVAEEVGFAVIDENLYDEKFEYTLKSCL